MHSELELPYIPKQVLDCVYIEQLLADKNLLDEVDPAIGRMGNLSVHIYILVCAHIHSRKRTHKWTKSTQPSAICGQIDGAVSAKLLHM